jgi:sarcosine oxidase subunit beta
MKGAKVNNFSSKSYDVIVIGAGSIGTPLALSLSAAGVKTLVLDQLSSVGQGSNKKAIGGVRATHSDKAKIRICLRSLEIMRTWQDIYGDDIEWQQGGYCFVAYQPEDEQTLKTLLSRQKQLGLNIDWLDHHALLQAVPDLNSRHLLGGTFSPEDGSCSPLLFLHACYQHACRLGACFQFDEQVTSIDVHHGQITGLHTTRGAYQTRIVINAAGAWAAGLSSQAGISIQVRPDSHEAGITEPVAKFLGPMIVDIRPVAASSNFYFYQHSTGQIIFCLTPSPNIWGFDQRETSKFLPLAAQRLINLIPRLTNIRVRRTWRGLYPMTPDGFPIVGWSNEVPGLFLAVGMCGQGLMLGPGLAELITRSIIASPAPEDDDTLSYLSPYRKFETEEKLK